MKKNAGFTLLELTMAMGVLAFVAVVSLTAVHSSYKTTKLIEDVSESADGVRKALSVLGRELELAATEDDSSLSPAVAAITVQESSGPETPLSVTFQVPKDPAAGTWSAPITYRYVNEDLNGNALLDSGEDTDQDGVLTRHIVRSTTENGQLSERIVAAANNLSDVDFEIIPDAQGLPARVRVTIEASENLERNSPGRVNSFRAEAEIYLQN